MPWDMPPEIPIGELDRFPTTVVGTAVSLSFSFTCLPNKRLLGMLELEFYVLMFVEVAASAGCI